MIEIFRIIKETLTSIYFWIPILFMAYILLQLYLMFYISPLTIIILPLILILYAGYLQDEYLKLIEKKPVYRDLDEVLKEYKEIIDKNNS